MAKSPRKTKKAPKPREILNPVGIDVLSEDQLDYYHAISEVIRKREHRFCWVDPDLKRPCGTCPAVNFGGTDFEFWAVDFANPVDGKMGTITFRVAPDTGNPTSKVRAERLKYELPKELFASAQDVMAKTKYGPGWQFMKLAEIGRRAQTFATMLRAVETGKHRRACACEVAAWLSSHDDDRQNMEVSLNAIFRPFMNAHGE